MELTSPGFWSDPEFTNTGLLVDLARSRRESALTVLRNPNVTGEDLVEVAKIAKWSRLGVRLAGAFELMRGRTAEDQYQLIMHAAKRSPVTVQDLLVHANTDCLARLHAAIEVGARGTARIAEAWPVVANDFSRLWLDPSRPRYMTLLRSLHQSIPVWNRAKFILALVAGADTAEDDALLAQLVAQHYPYASELHAMTIDMVLRAWDDPDRLLRWCAGSETGTLIASAHPRLAPEKQAGLVPVTNARLPRLALIHKPGLSGQLTWHARIAALHDSRDDTKVTSIGGHLLELVKAMSRDNQTWSYLWAVDLIDSDTVPEAEKVILARAFTRRCFAGVNRVGKLINRYATMATEDRLDQLAHLDDDDRLRLRHLLRINSSDAGTPVEFIRTDDQARAEEGTSVWTDVYNPAGGHHRCRWPAAPWLNDTLTSAEQLAAVAFADQTSPGETLYDYVHRIVAEHPDHSAGTDRYTDVIGDALGQL